jgi:hypothetical protein
METIDLKIPYVKSKTYKSKEIDIPTMLNMVVVKLDQWKQDLSKPFTRKDALTLLTYKEDDDHILLKYGINRNKWGDLEGRTTK